jgi:hypothetical protein
MSHTDNISKERESIDQTLQKWKIAISLAQNLPLYPAYDRGRKWAISIVWSYFFAGRDGGSEFLLVQHRGGVVLCHGRKGARHEDRY